MKVSVWDSYVKRNDGKLMHFDILVPETMTDETQILKFGSSYLTSKPFNSEELTTNECRFCHIETATEDVIKNIESKGFSIIEMENCN